MTMEAITDRLVQCIAWDIGKGDPKYKLESAGPYDYENRAKEAYKGSGELIAYNAPDAARAELYKRIHDEYIRPAWGDRLKIIYVRDHRFFDEVSDIIKTYAEPGTIILMDYLQQFKPMKIDADQDNKPRYFQIRRVIDEIILDAEKTKSVVICAAQLNRTERESEIKQADDTQGWRESGDIEQNAHNLIKMFLQVNSDNPAEKQMSYRVSKARTSAHLGEAFILDWTPKYQHMVRTNEAKPKAPPWITDAKAREGTRKAEQKAYQAWQKKENNYNTSQQNQGGASGALGETDTNNDEEFIITAESVKG